MQIGASGAGLHTAQVLVRRWQVANRRVSQAVGITLWLGWAEVVRRTAAGIKVSVSHGEFCRSGWSADVAGFERIGSCWRTCCVTWRPITLGGCEEVGAFAVMGSRGLDCRLGPSFLVLRG